jgi:hypothetical protein
LYSRVVDMLKNQVTPQHKWLDCPRLKSLSAAHWTKFAEMGEEVWWVRALDDDSDDGDYYLLVIV